MAHIKYPSRDISSALAASSSVNEAATLLGMSTGSLNKWCKKDPELLPYWEKARERGLAKRRRWGHR